MITITQVVKAIVIQIMYTVGLYDLKLVCKSNNVD
jgi:hypothetical protein